MPKHAFTYAYTHAHAQSYLSYIQTFGGQRGLVSGRPSHTAGSATTKQLAAQSAACVWAWACGRVGVWACGRVGMDVGGQG